jgi:hypothetical protein
VERDDRSSSPYRAPSESSFEAEPNREPDLGSERSVHPGRVGAVSVSAAFALGMILLVGLAVAPMLGWLALALVSSLALAAGAWLGIDVLRIRGTRVVLHQRGLVVATRGARTVIPFSSVCDVWWEGVSWAMYRANVSALRLVDDSGRAHRVPLIVERADEVMSWVDRHCSAPLLSEARAALRVGETLTFGSVRFDRESVSLGRSRVPWTRIRLVRLLPGRVAFFRSFPIFPWKTVRLDRVPHPSIFARLLRDAAPKVEVYPPIAHE